MHSLSRTTWRLQQLPGTTAATGLSSTAAICQAAWQQLQWLGCWQHGHLQLLEEQDHWRYQQDARVLCCSSLDINLAATQHQAQQQGLLHGKLAAHPSKQHQPRPPSWLLRQQAASASATFVAAAPAHQQQQQLGFQLAGQHWHNQRQYRTRVRPSAHRHPKPADTASDSNSDSSSEELQHITGSIQHGERHHQLQQQQHRQRPHKQQQQQLPPNFQQQWRQQWRVHQAQQEQDTLPHSHHQHQVNSNSSSSGSNSSSSRSQADIQSSSRLQSQPLRQQQGQHTPKSIDAIGITQAISATSSLPALQQLLQQHKEQLQQIHICAAYKAVVRLSVGLRDKTMNHEPAAVPPPQDTADTPGSTSGRSWSSSSSSSWSSSSSRTTQLPVDGNTALEVLRDLSKRMQQQIRVARPWDLAQAAWACSKLQYRDQRLLEAIAQQAQRKAAILTPQDISQLASAYARLNYPQHQLLQLLQTQAVAKAADFKPWVLVHTAWALHVCGHDVTQLLTVAVPLLRDRERLEELKGLDMSSLLWLLAGHSLFDEELLSTAAGLLSTTISSYSPASVANTLMACAALGFSTPPLSAAAASTVLAGLQQRQYAPRQVALSVFALAKLQACDRQLLEAAAAQFQQAAQAYSPPLLSMLVWAVVLSKQVPVEGFVPQLLTCSRQRLVGFSGDQLSSLLRGLVALPEQPSSDTLLLLDEVRALLPDKLPAVSTPVLTSLIKSLGKQLRRAQEVQQQQLDNESVDGVACLQGTGTNSACSSSSSSSSSSSASGHLHLHAEPAGAEQAVLAGMLQLCVAEWAKPLRTAQLTHWQAVSVERVLRDCGQLDLVPVVQQVVEALQAAALQQTHESATAMVRASHPNAVAPSTRPSGTAAAAGTWVDSFVASTE